MLVLSPRLFFDELLDGILYEMAHVSELWMALEESSKSFVGLLIDCEAFNYFGHRASSLINNYRKYYIFLSPSTR
jgi:hypothetical protein